MGFGTPPKKCGTAARLIKKPTRLSTLECSTTSAYSLTDSPARLGRPFSSHPMLSNSLSGRPSKQQVNAPKVIRTDANTPAGRFGAGSEVRQSTPIGCRASAEPVLPFNAEMKASKSRSYRASGVWVRRPRHLKVEVSVAFRETPTFFGSDEPRVPPHREWNSVRFRTATNSQGQRSSFRNSLIVASSI
jgi:hypothetical protein